MNLIFRRMMEHMFVSNTAQENHQHVMDDSPTSRNWMQNVATFMRTESANSTGRQAANIMRTESASSTGRPGASFMRTESANSTGRQAATIMRTESASSAGRPGVIFMRTESANSTGRQGAYLTGQGDFGCFLVGQSQSESGSTQSQESSEPNAHDLKQPGSYSLVVCAFEEGPDEVTECLVLEYVFRGC